MKNIRFEGVKVVDPKYKDGLSHWFKSHGGLNQYFVCEGVEAGTGVAVDSDPVPSCFNSKDQAFKSGTETSYDYSRDSDGCSCTNLPW